MTERRYRFMIAYAGPPDFPLDLLRQDQCWPADTADAVTIAALLRGATPGQDGLVQVSLIGGQLPSVEDWAGHGWRVIRRDVRDDYRWVEMPPH